MSLVGRETFLIHVDRFNKVWVTILGEASSQAVAYESLSDFENDASSYLVDWATRALEDFSYVALEAAVEDFYRSYGTSEEKRAYGVDDRPYSVCVKCHRVIVWDEGDIAYADKETGRITCLGEEGEVLPHRAAWLTLAEFRAMTKNLPDNTPITAYAGNLGDGVSDWVNVGITAEAVENHTKADGDPSLILDLYDTFDTRQW